MLGLNAIARGYKLTFRAPTDAQPAIFVYDVPQFSHVIMFAPTTKCECIVAQTHLYSLLVIFMLWPFRSFRRRPEPAISRPSLERGTHYQSPRRIVTHHHPPLPSRRGILPRTTAREHAPRLALPRPNTPAHRHLPQPPTPDTRLGLLPSTQLEHHSSLLRGPSAPRGRQPPGVLDPPRTCGELQHGHD